MGHDLDDSELRATRKLLGLEKQSDEEIRRLNKHDELRMKMLNIYKAKNHDYGASVSDTYKKFGADAFLVRMYDKMNRLYTLTRKDTVSMAPYEKIEDTLLDLANYALLFIIEMSESDKEVKNEREIQ